MKNSAFYGFLVVLTVVFMASGTFAFAQVPDTSNSNNATSEAVPPPANTQNTTDDTGVPPTSNTQNTTSSGDSSSDTPTPAPSGGGGGGWGNGPIFIPTPTIPATTPVQVKLTCSTYLNEYVGVNIKKNQ